MRDLSSAAPPRVAASAILPPAAGNRSDLARGTAESLPASPLVRILGVMVFNFLSYLAVGLPLAVLPAFIHDQLGYGAMVAGAAISVQYLATLLSRPHAGRLADSVGAKRTVLVGLLSTTLGGALLLAAAWLTAWPLLSLIVIVGSRLAIGFGESWIGTGSLMWAMGRMNGEQSARVISWSGICTYGALAASAPLGVAISATAGFAWLGAAMAVIGGLGYWRARRIAPVPVVIGERMRFSSVLLRVAPMGIALALGAAGFGVIATFITLFYSAQQWGQPAWALTAFGASFIVGRLLFSHTIRRWGGFRPALASLACEALGLLLLAAAPDAAWALAGAALTGLGWALVFPALGVEVVAMVPPASKGAAIAAFSVFFDVAMGLTGPAAGLAAELWGFRSVYALASAACIVALALAWMLYRRHRQSAASPRLASHPS
ncbi:putative MFS family arabinose efflux permease [Comamonas sp. BIGb0124]|uniref:MFS transporter n=1 Tax=Comamonas sp. BIGb0124 TaxID=2485130 RepID=UPI000F4941E0|nr:MFS transporter [Comamonas sp. BIGb0124]ROR16288.1 putative MFS family arabinose efflux permease [Comamonas sp. BIGb0124]